MRPQALPRALLLLALLAVLLLVYVASRHAVHSGTGGARPEPDTLHRQRPPAVIVIPDKELSRPEVVYIYREPDTARRRALEAGTLLESVVLKGERLEVTTITPAGQVSMARYRARGYKTLTITSGGRVALRRRTRAGRILYGAGQVARKSWKPALMAAGVFVIARAL